MAAASAVARKRAATASLPESVVLSALFLVNRSRLDEDKSVTGAAVRNNRGKAVLAVLSILCRGRLCGLRGAPPKYSCPPILQHRILGLANTNRQHGWVRDKAMQPPCADTHNTPTGSDAPCPLSAHCWPSITAAAAALLSQRKERGLGCAKEGCNPHPLSAQQGAQHTH